MSAADSLDICMAQRENMEAIFHSVADGIVTIDVAGRVTNVNHAAEHLLGVSADGAAGRPMSEFVTCRAWSVREVCRQVMTTGNAVRARENVLVVGDGLERHVLVTCSRLLDRDQTPAGAVVTLRDITEVRELRTRLEARGSVEGLVGSSHAMQVIYTLIDEVAPTDTTVLIEGETGTGKELVADALHRRSRRAIGPFVKVNGSALSESLLESELFGHAKGAFTGAHLERKGRFELADGGTLFLDEIGDLSPGIQVKLLRVLQEREIERVGEARVRPIDVRVITATHRSLRELVADGRFREDLYYRLNVIPIRMPPLRERLGDVPDLATLFLAETGTRVHKAVRTIHPDALRALMDHRWPGNVRELRNAIEHAVVKARTQEITLADLPTELTASVSPNVGSPATTSGGPDERTRVLTALERSGWHRGRAAARLGMDRSTLWRKMRRLGIDPP